MGDISLAASSTYPQWNQPAPTVGQRPHTLAVQEQIGRSSKLVKRFKLGDFKFEIRKSLDAFWIVARAKTGGGVALRAVYSANGELEVTKTTTRDSVSTFRIVGTTMGVFAVTLETFDLNVPTIRVTVTLRLASHC